MRTRFFLFAAAVATALAVHLGLVSPRIAQTAEETVRSRLALASSGVRTQLEVLDLRISPRLAALSPDLIDATRAPVDPSQPPGRPDERALRAAAAALQPEPDLLIVAGTHGAAVSRRGKAASLGEDPAVLPLVKSAQDPAAAPRFATVDGKLYRVAAAHTPANSAVVITGTLVDDRLAEQMRSQIEADVSFVQDGSVVASSLPPGEPRASLAQWAKSPSPGYGSLPVILPFIGTRLTGKLPLGASRAATRGALLELAPGLLAAVTIPAPAAFAWLARYQAFYGAGWALFLLAALLWGSIAFHGQRAGVRSLAEEPRPGALTAASARSEALVGADVSAPSDAARPAPPHSELPWTQEPTPPPVPRIARGPEPLDLEVPAAPVAPATAAEPIWTPEFSPVPAAAAERAAKAAAAPPFPGDEPTRQGPVSAALLEKMRERDEVRSGASDLGAGWTTPPAGTTPSLPPEWAAPETEPPLPAPKQKDVTPGGFASSEEQDPDEAHFRETFEKFVALREETGEAANLSYEKFAAKLRKNREELLARSTAKSVRFSVYKKDGRAAIKASALR